MLVPIALSMLFFPAHYYDKPEEQIPRQTNAGEISHELLDNSRRLSSAKERKLSKHSIYKDDLKPPQKSFL
jgi:hypothetical protein